MTHRSLLPVRSKRKRLPRRYFRLIRPPVPTRRLFVSRFRRSLGDVPRSRRRRLFPNFESKTSRFEILVHGGRTVTTKSKQSTPESRFSQKNRLTFSPRVRLRRFDGRLRNVSRGQSGTSQPADRDAVIPISGPSRIRETAENQRKLPVVP